MLVTVPCTYPRPTGRDLMPVCVVEDLADLRGPTSGQVTLPIRLDWSPRPTYDLDDPLDARSMYETVLREAFHESDLTDFLNIALLKQLWAGLVIPVKVRTAWEQVHPELAQC